ncbi:MAG TPA: DUF6600 domain-containing protein [Bryobacteraceae bacterium]|nr:DUF6600 domain-containing protein [Bryobacteraceae bacterium]
MWRARSLAAAAVGAAVMIGAGCEMLRFPTQLPGPPAAVPESIDPPRRVARLSYPEGTVSLRIAGTRAWAPAFLNRPLTDGDELWTEARGRAELDLGAVAVRMNSSTSLGILDLDDRSAQFKITQGQAGILLRRLDPGDTFEIDTPNAAITLLRPGDYRIDVDAGRDLTSVTVHAGTAHVTTLKESYTIYPPQQGLVTGTEASTYRLVPAREADAFDEFSQTRDRCERAARASVYVSPDAIGSYELDEYGAWRIDPTWGPVWTPRAVPAGWAPFRFGRWLWIEPWGWTWTDDAPWGFVTSHYGRWGFLEARWSWLPGPRYVRPVYTPAAVMFLDGENRPVRGFGRRVPPEREFLWMGRPELAWFPLGPGEAYIPPFRCTHGYLTDINVTNTAIANPLELPNLDVAQEQYLNRTAPGAVTAVTQETFAGGGSVGRAAIAAPPHIAATAKVSGRAPAVAPTLFSVSPGMGSGVSQPPEALRVRQVLVWRIPIPEPLPFERIETLRKSQSAGQPLDRARLDQLRRMEPSPRPDVRPVQPSGLEPGRDELLELQEQRR